MTLALLSRGFGPKKLLSFVSSKPVISFFRFDPDDTKRLLNYIEFVLCHWPFCAKEGACFLRSFTLFCFLKPVHHELKIILGLRMKDQTLKGHAWLELGGKPYLDKEAHVSSFEKVFTHM